MSRYRPLTPEALAAELAATFLAASDDLRHPLRVGVDGPAVAGPDELARSIADRLQAPGRAGVVIKAESFWRDASLRLEYGHTDADAYYDGWLDAGALNREVLVPLGPGGPSAYLPALRDPVTNRSARLASRPLPAPAVLLVSGDLLLGRGLAFDRTVHLAVSPAARERRTPPEDRWTLAALARYDRDVDPGEQADITVSWNDAARPALRA